MFALLTLVLAATPAFTAPKDRLDLLEKAEAELAKSPDDAKLIVKTALARKMAGHFDESIDLLTSCKKTPCAMVLAVTLAMTDDAAQVVPLLEKLASVTTQAKEDQASSWRLLSQARLRAGRPADAVAAAQKAVDLVPAPMMVLDLAVAQFAAGQAAEAEASLDVVLAKAPTQQAALYWKYRCLDARGDKGAGAAARAAFDALVESVDGKLLDRGDLHFLLAEVATKLGEKAREARHREIARKLHVTRHWPEPGKP